MSKEQIRVKGEDAMSVISDYPLYASTSGITYEEAMAIAKIIDPEWEKRFYDVHGY